MAGRYLLILALGAGMTVAASCSAIAAQPSNGSPAVTGSMYNGNNAQPPDMAAHEARSDTPGPAGGDQHNTNIAREAGR